MGKPGCFKFLFNTSFFALGSSPLNGKIDFVCEFIGSFWISDSISNDFTFIIHFIGQKFCSDKWLQVYLVCNEEFD